MLFGCNLKKKKDLSRYWNAFMRFSNTQPDGWGIALAGEKPLLIKERQCALESDIAWHLVTGEKKNQFTSANAIFHLRYASKGKVAFRNSHPFRINNWLFAHNGTINHNITTTRKPKGETDSELAFCYLWERLQKKTKRQTDFSVISDICLEMGDGFNFLLASRNTLYAYWSGYNSLYWIETQIGYFISTIPISDDNWNSFNIGELVMLRKGKLIKSIKIYPRRLL